MRGTFCGLITLTALLLGGIAISADDEFRSGSGQSKAQDYCEDSAAHATKPPSDCVPQKVRPGTDKAGCEFKVVEYLCQGGKSLQTYTEYTGSAAAQTQRARAKYLQQGKNSQQGGATGASVSGTQANVAQPYQKRAGYNKGYDPRNPPLPEKVPQGKPPQGGAPVSFGKTGKPPIHTGDSGGVVKFNSNMGKNSQQGGATGASGSGTQANVAQPYQKRAGYNKGYDPRNPPLPEKVR